MKYIVSDILFQARSGQRSLRIGENRILINGGSPDLLKFEEWTFDEENWEVELKESALENNKFYAESFLTSPLFCWTENKLF